MKECAYHQRILTCNPGVGNVYGLSSVLVLSFLMDL